MINKVSDIISLSHIRDNNLTNVTITDQCRDMMVFNSLRNLNIRLKSKVQNDYERSFHKWKLVTVHYKNRNRGCLNDQCIIV